MPEKDWDFVQDVIEKESKFHSNSTLDNVDIPTPCVEINSFNYLVCIKSPLLIDH